MNDKSHVQETSKNRFLKRSVISIFSHQHIPAEFGHPFRINRNKQLSSLFLKLSIQANFLILFSILTLCSSDIFQPVKIDSWIRSYTSLMWDKEICP